MKKPECLGELLELSKRLSNMLENPPFVRIDFYIIDNKIYFGELTFYHGSGTEEFSPSEFNGLLGEKVVLPVVE